MMDIRYAVVTGVNPLRVQFDGEMTPSKMSYKRPRYYKPQVQDRVVFLVVRRGGSVEYVFLGQVE